MKSTLKLKGTVHPKITIQSLSAHLHAVHSPQNIYGDLDQNSVAAFFPPTEMDKDLLLFIEVTETENTPDQLHGAILCLGW